ncbi:unnamed protein product [Soboliphyme baturini]|uniref:WD_REPEATS_REGION domain-containing protein n=1 Tax=Soboliphyme baturini TaxID=241478 RepID=A0A183J7D2_9BILA|nr:unnamed protein product [Soboliphyme baturini]
MKGSVFGGDLPLEAHVLRKQWLMIPAVDKPILHAISLQKRNRHHVRSFLPSAVSCIEVAPDGSVCCAGVGEYIYTWSICNGKLRSIVDGHYQTVSKIKFTSDGSYLVSAAKDGIVIVWNVGEYVSRLKQSQFVVGTVTVFQSQICKLAKEELQPGFSPARWINL